MPRLTIPFIIVAVLVFWAGSKYGNAVFAKIGMA